MKKIHLDEVLLINKYEILIAESCMCVPLPEIVRLRASGLICYMAAGTLLLLSGSRKFDHSRQWSELLKLLLCGPPTNFLSGGCACRCRVQTRALASRA